MPTRHSGGHFPLSGRGRRDEGKERAATPAHWCHPNDTDATGCLLWVVRDRVEPAASAAMCFLPRKRKHPRTGVDALDAPDGQAEPISCGDGRFACWKSAAPKSRIREPYQADLGRPCSPRKYHFCFSELCGITLAIPRLRRGAARDRQERWSGMRWTRRCRVRMRSQGGETS